MQPFCWIMRGAHSVFHTRTAFSASDGSSVSDRERGGAQQIPVASFGVGDGLMEEGGSPIRREALSRRTERDNSNGPWASFIAENLVRIDLLGNA